MSYYQKKSLHSKSLFPAELFYHPITKSSSPRRFLSEKVTQSASEEKAELLGLKLWGGSPGSCAHIEPIVPIRHTLTVKHYCCCVSKHHPIFAPFQINSPKLCSLFRFSIILPPGCCYWYSVFTSRPSATFASNKVNRQCPDPFLHTFLHQQYLKHKRCLFEMHKHPLHLHKHLPVHPYALGHTFRFPFFQCL